MLKHIIILKNGEVIEVNSYALTVKEKAVYYFTDIDGSGQIGGLIPLDQIEMITPSQ